MRALLMVVALLATSGVLAGRAQAYLARFYSPPIDQFTWDASTIVLVRQPDVTAGRVEVIECWAGGLPTGTALRVPISTSAPERERTVTYSNDLRAGTDMSEVPPDSSAALMELFGTPASVATGRRVLLFLGPLERAGGDLPSAPLIDQVWPSVFYLEKDIALGSLRVDHREGPGLYPLVWVRGTRPWPVSERDLRERVASVRGSRARYDMALHETSADARVRGLAEMLTATAFPAMEAATQALSREGERALPPLLAALEHVYPRPGTDGIGSFGQREKLLCEAVRGITGDRAGDYLVPVLDRLLAAMLEIHRTKSERPDWDAFYEHQEAVERILDVLEVAPAVGARDVVERLCVAARVDFDMGGSGAERRWRGVLWRIYQR